jgi:tetrahydromethanopterin S-methyltransferase subunit E
MTVGLFVRLTILVALGIVALFVLAFILKALIIGAIVAALILAVFFVVGGVRRLSGSRNSGPLVRR